MAGKGTADLLRIFDKDANGTFDEATDSLEAIADSIGGSNDTIDDILEDTGTTLPAAITAAEEAIRGADDDDLKVLSDQMDAIVAGGGESVSQIVALLYPNPTCDAGMTPSTTDIYCVRFKGYSDDYFNDRFYLQILRNANSIGAAPEGEIRAITDYVSATGKIVCDAFTANVEEGDSLLVIHEIMIDLQTTADSIETKVDTVDTVVDAIKAKTDNLPTDPADQSLLMAAIAAKTFTSSIVSGNLAASASVAIPTGRIVTAIYVEDTIAIEMFTNTLGWVDIGLGETGLIWTGALAGNTSYLRLRETGGITDRDYNYLYFTL